MGPDVKVKIKVKEKGKEKRHSQRNVEESISIIKKYGYNCYFTKDHELISSDKLENKEIVNNYFFLPIKS